MTFGPLTVRTAVSTFMGVSVGGAMSATRSPSLRRTATLALVLAGSLALPATPAQAESWTPPPPPDGVLTDLRAPLKSLTISEGVIGPDHTGRLVAYAVPLGENAQLNVIDVQTRTISRRSGARCPRTSSSSVWRTVPTS